MKQTQDDRRRAQRYQIPAKASVHKENGDRFDATIVNISSCGMLLHATETTGFQVGDVVMVEVDLPQIAGHAFSDWGVGSIVRIDSGGYAVDLSAGSFAGL